MEKIILFFTLITTISGCDIFGELSYKNKTKSTVTVSYSYSSEEQLIDTFQLRPGEKKIYPYGLGMVWNEENINNVIKFHNYVTIKNDNYEISINSCNMKSFLLLAKQDFSKDNRGYADA